LIGRQLPQEYYHERDQLEAAWFAESRQLSDWAALTEKALLEESAFTQRWETRLSGTTCGSRRFLRYWEKKNQRLGQPRA